MDKNSDPRKRGAWLLAVVASSVVAWPISSLLGIFWSRWLRPFSTWGWIGYMLCWALITVVPFVLFYIWFTYKPLQADRVWQPGLYVICIAIWLAAGRWLVQRPSPNLARSFLVSALGTLLVGPSMTFGGQAAVFLPFGACLAWNVTRLIGDGAVPGLFNGMAMAIIPAVPVFIAHLAVLWPQRGNSIQHAAQQGAQADVAKSATPLS